MNLKGTKPKIFKLLTERPEMRDSDMRLIVNIWKDEMDWKNMTGEQVLTQLAHNPNITNPESIRRCRQKINEQKPETRGKSYQPRQKGGEKIRREIHQL